MFQKLLYQKQQKKGICIQKKNYLGKKLQKTISVFLVKY